MQEESSTSVTCTAHFLSDRPELPRLFQICNALCEKTRKTRADSLDRFFMPVSTEYIPDLCGVHVDGQGHLKLVARGSLHRLLLDAPRV